MDDRGRPDEPARLRPHARVLHRGPGEVQLGLGTPGAAAPTLTGLSHAELAWLVELERGQSRLGPAALAARLGVPAARSRRLTAWLEARGLLASWEDIPPLRDPGGLVDARVASAWRAAGRALDATAGLGSDAVAATGRAVRRHGWEAVLARRSARVLLAGDGPLADEIEATLLRCAVTRVARGYDILDRALHLAGDLHGPSPALPDVVIALGAPAAPAVPLRPLLGSGVAHLLVGVRAEQIDVGPLVVPGAGPCGECVEHHLCDADPVRPALLQQLGVDGPAARRAVAVDAALARRGAGHIVTAVTGLLDQRWAGQAAEGPEAVVEQLVAGTTTVWRQAWGVHPRCPGHTAAMSVAALPAPEASAPEVAVHGLPAPGVAIPEARASALPA